VLQTRNLRSRGFSCARESRKASRYPSPLPAVACLFFSAPRRDHEINAIVQSIEELSQIFKELAVLVIDQGTILDRIDYNMEQVGLA